MICQNLLRFRSSVLSLSVAFSVCVAGTASIAQPVLEEVVVTAQHREQNNQNIAVAVTAIDQHELRAADFSSTVDIGPEIPGLVVTTYNTANPQYFIRGIGSTGTSAGEDPSVSVFVDGAYAGRGGTTSMDFLDLQRVEVLRGPQGTLFGRNAAGGLIQMISQKPVFDTEGYFGASVGSDDEYNLHGTFNSILFGQDENTSLLSRFSFKSEKRDGYVTNIATGSDSLRESDDVSARWHLLKHFSVDTRALLTLNYADSEQVGASSRKAFSRQNPLTVAGFIPLPQPSADIDTVTLATDGPTSRETSGVKLKIEHELEGMRFESITAFLNNDYRVVEDISAVGLIVVSQDEDAKQWTQEFRLLSDYSSELQWTLGFYFLDEQVNRFDVTDVTAISDILNLNPLVNIPDEIARYDQEASNTSAALYGQLEYILTEALTLVAGARYTDDSKELWLNATGADPLLFGILPLGPYVGRVEKDFDNFSTHLSLNYSLNEDVLVYGQFSQGYKAGGFDGNSITLLNLNEPFDEEKANNFEMGLKAQWFENRLRTNVALFFTDYEDLQVFQVTNTGLQFIDNAASAEIKGLEFEVDVLFTEQLNGNLSCAFLENTYEDFISAVDDNNDMLPDDLSGNTLTRSPETSCSLALSYSPVLPSGQPLDIRLSYSYQDEVYITPQNRPFDTIDSFGLFNLGVQYQINSAISVGLYGKNLTDEKYMLHTYDADPLARNNVESSIYAAPRTWKATIRYDF